MIYEVEMRQQNIKYYEGGLDLRDSKIALHEVFHYELRLHSGTTYRTGEDVFCSFFFFFNLLTSVKDIKYEMEAAPRVYECTG